MFRGNGTGYRNASVTIKKGGGIATFFIAITRHRRGKCNNKLHPISWLPNYCLNIHMRGNHLNMILLLTQLPRVVWSALDVIHNSKPTKNIKLPFYHRVASDNRRNEWSSCKGIATSVLTSLEWLVNLSYNLYMIFSLQNYPEVPQFSDFSKLFTTVET